MSFDSFTKLFFDAYERRARLTPALLALLPLLAAVIMIFHQSISIWTSLLTLAISSGVLFLLSDIARGAGKSCQDSLFKLWGNKPSVIVLRHSDTTINPITKEGFHDFLSKQLGKPLPTLEQERADPCTADALYDASTSFLIGATQNKKNFPLVHIENANYGFRRNAYGLRLIGVIISIFSLSAVLLDAYFRYGAESIEAHMAFKPEIMAEVIFQLAFLVIWLLFFTKSRVRQAGFAYALALVGSCHALTVQNKKNLEQSNAIKQKKTAKEKESS